MRSIGFGTLLALTLLHSNVLAQGAGERAPLWPPDCTRGMPRDGLVLLDGSALGVAPSAAAALHVRLLRTSDGVAVDGSLDGSEQPAGAPLRWRSQAALRANTEYKIEVRMRGVEDPALTGYFTTGDAFIAPLAFSGRPAVRLLARAPGSDAQPETVLVRIAVPQLTGGLAQRPVSLSVAWAETTRDEAAASLRGQQEEAVLPATTLGFELEAQLTDEPQERCLDVVARDDLGQELALDPALCVSLPARSGAEPAFERDDVQEAGEGDQSAVRAGESEGQSLERRASRQLADDVPHEQSGDGCALSRQRGELAGAWVLAALLPLLARRRPRI